MRSGASAEDGERLRFARSALRDLDRLDPPIRRRVLEALGGLADTGRGDVTRLRGLEPLRTACA
jgi:mRNA-degrading endonuclease RelE of RelBE toxin-antitoxin system